MPPDATAALQARIAEIEHDDALQCPQRLRERIKAMDRLDALLLDSVDDDVRRRAIALMQQLEAVNQTVYHAIRQAIRRGEGKTAMRDWMHVLATPADTPCDGQGYDALDTLLAGVLPFDEPADDDSTLPAEMVFYQPTPARHILDLIDRVGLDATDVLIDLGSGLGHVPLLAAICTGARCIGIERNPAYVACARHGAEALELGAVAFIEQDARIADLSAGTVFYLYTPFTGTVLRRVLDMLEHEAAGRAIRIATLGPCTAIVAGEPWLAPLEPTRPDRIAVFRPIPPRRA